MNKISLNLLLKPLSAGGINSLTLLVLLTFFFLFLFRFYFYPFMQGEIYTCAKFLNTFLEISSKCEHPDPALCTAKVNHYFSHVFCTNFLFQKYWCKANQNSCDYEAIHLACTIQNPKDRFSLVRAYITLLILKPSWLNLFSCEINSEQSINPPVCFSVYFQYLR